MIKPLSILALALSLSACGPDTSQPDGFSDVGASGGNLDLDNQTKDLLIDHARGVAGEMGVSEDKFSKALNHATDMMDSGASKEEMMDAFKSATGHTLPSE